MCEQWKYICPSHAVAGYYCSLSEWCWNQEWTTAIELDFMVCFSPVWLLLRNTHLLMIFTRDCVNPKRQANLLTHHWCFLLNVSYINPYMSLNLAHMPMENYCKWENYIIIVTIIDDDHYAITTITHRALYPSNLIFVHFQVHCLQCMWSEMECNYLLFLRYR